MADFDVGIDAYWGRAIASNDVQEIKIDFEPVNINDVDLILLMYHDIISRIGKNLRNCCIIVEREYINDIRKEFVKQGLSCGFKNVELLNVYWAYYTIAVLKSNYEPKKEDTVLIITDQEANYFKLDGKAPRYLGDLNEYKLREKTYSEVRKANCKVILIENTVENKERCILKKTFKQQDIFEYERCDNITVALLRAKMDLEDFYYTVRIIDFSFVIEVGQDIKVNIGMDTQVPMVKTLKLKAHNNNKEMTVTKKFLCMATLNEEYVAETFTLPNFSTYFLRFKLDENMIYSIEFVDATDCENNQRKNESISTIRQSYIKKRRYENYVDSNFTFPFPDKTIINNEQINAIAIDFGTSRCCVAAYIEQHLVVLPIGESLSNNIIQSCLIYDHVNNMRVATIQDKLWDNPNNSVFGFKMMIGRKYYSLMENEKWKLDLIDSSNKPLIRLKFGTTELRQTPEQVATTLIKEIKLRAEYFLGKKVSDAVITIPAVFTNAQKKEIQMAASLAGFDKVVLLLEPLAATFAYFQICPNETNVLVFDMGSGKLDICLMEFKKSQVQIVSKHACGFTLDSYQSAEDFDDVLVKYFKNKLESEYDITNINFYKLLIECQGIKHDLSFSNEARLDVENFDPSKKGFIYISVEIFQNLSQNVFKSIESSIRHLLMEARYAYGQVKNVLRCGGGCRMPGIQKLLQEQFPEAEHHCKENWDEIIAIGAAYHARNAFS